MRRALGLADAHGGPPGRPFPEQQRPNAPVRLADRPVGDRPRQRFVKDGDVPVTLVSRHPVTLASRHPVTLVSRHRPHEADAPVAPSIGVAETTVASERAAREKAERSLGEALAMVHDLQTKHGHAELAHREASEAAQAAHERREARLNDELAAERAARAAAEAALQEVAVARERAERDLQAILAVTPAPKPKDALVQRKAKSPVKRPRKAASVTEEREPQPVKWWLRTASKR